MQKTADIEKLEEALGYRFARRELLEQALTHSSYANEQEASGDNLAGGERPAHNEQLEFLGDAVLGLVTSRILFDRYPNYGEGLLSKTRAHLVSARHLVKVGRQLRLGDYLRLGKGEERSGGRAKAALLVDAVEAVIAAMYLDGSGANDAAGVDAARRFIQEKIVDPELARMRDPEAVLAMADQKSALQEWLQATGRPQPSYQVVNEEGPDHKKLFTVEVRVADENGNESMMGRAQGGTKKLAEQRAAEETLRQLKSEETVTKG